MCIRGPLRVDKVAGQNFSVFIPMCSLRFFGLLVCFDWYALGGACVGMNRIVCFIVPKWSESEHV